MMILAGIAIISASSYSIDEAMAFPHASLIIDPREPDANDIRIVVGHTNEPAYGKLPGIHDGKHNLEVDISDAATTLPIPNATLFADKYYFKNIESFQRADSLQEADAIQQNVPISAVFGQSGTFYNRQVIDPGIYGYTIRGVINYYDEADVPIKGITKFCSIPGVDLTKFDSPKPDWTGSYGCPENIKSIFFPPARKYPDNYNNYPPKDPQYDDGYVNYQQQYDDSNNNYGYVNEDYQQSTKDNTNYDYVNEDYQQSTKDNTNYDDMRDNSRDDKKNDNKEYDNNYDNNNNNYDYPYSYEYTDDNGKYGNEYAAYEE